MRVIFAGRRPLRTLPDSTEHAVLHPGDPRSGASTSGAAGLSRRPHRRSATHCAGDHGPFPRVRWARTRTTRSSSRLASWVLDEKRRAGPSTSTHSSGTDPYVQHRILGRVTEPAVRAVVAPAVFLGRFDGRFLAPRPASSGSTTFGGPRLAQQEWVAVISRDELGCRRSSRSTSTCRTGCDGPSPSHNFPSTVADWSRTCGPRSVNARWPSRGWTRSRVSCGSWTQSLPCCSGASSGAHRTRGRLGLGRRAPRAPRARRRPREPTAAGAHGNPCGHLLPSPRRSRHRCVSLAGRDRRHGGSGCRCTGRRAGVAGRTGSRDAQPQSFDGHAEEGADRSSGRRRECGPGARPEVMGRCARDRVVRRRAGPPARAPLAGRPRRGRPGGRAKRRRRPRPPELARALARARGPRVR